MNGSRWLGIGEHLVHKAIACYLPTLSFTISIMYKTTLLIFVIKGLIFFHKYSPSYQLFLGWVHTLYVASTGKLLYSSSQDQGHGTEPL